MAYLLRWANAMNYIARFADIKMTAIPGQTPLCPDAFAFGNIVGVHSLISLMIFCIRYHSAVFLYYNVLAKGYTGLLR